MTTRAHKQGGLTLVELLVAMAIIVLFAGMSLAAVQKGRAAARDNLRKETLRMLQLKIELYRDQHNGLYPSTVVSNSRKYFSSEPNDAYSDNGGDWIPGLAPTYISSLPRDPLGGNSTRPSPCPPYKSAYLYTSDGVNYALIAHCSPEQETLSNTDLFYDSNRPSWAWKVCTPVGCGW